MKHQDFDRFVSLFKKILTMVCLGLGLRPLSLHGYMTFVVTTSNMFFTYVAKSSSSGDKEYLQ